MTGSSWDAGRARPDRRTINIEGPVHYLDYEGVDGPTFVCVHGLGGSHANWLSFAPLLAQRGRVLVPDLAGFGRTPLAGRSASMEGNRALLDKFLVAMDAAPAILVGNSMGGLISILEASAAPDRVAGLVLIDPAAPRAGGAPIDRAVATMFATYMLPGFGEWAVGRRIRLTPPEQIVRETLAMACVDPSRVAPEVVTAGIEMAKERATYPWAVTALLQATRSMMRLLARRDRMRTIIASVSSPTLLVMGRQDRLVAVNSAEAIARARPDWDFVVLDDLGHVPMAEDPNAVIEEVDRWLAMVLDTRS